MDLREFTFEYTTEPKNVGGDLIDCGPATRRLYERIGDKGLTRSLIATNFWRAWMASDIASSFMMRLGAAPGVFERSRTIIVSLDDVARFDLVVLDSTLSPNFQPRSIGASLRGAMTDIIMRGAVRAFVEGEIPAIGAEATQLAAEASRNGEQPFVVMYAREPATERISVLTSPLAVLANGKSTAGILVEGLLQPGRFGITAALHGIDPNTSAQVGSHTGQVIRSDAVTDSAFIEVLPMPKLSTRKLRGIMSGMAPRGNQNGEFTGAISGSCQTVITGWDAQIPNPSSRRQACIYTRRDAQPSDSGSALVTDDDWIVGFAFERTKPGESPEQCPWIWAESVLNRLNVKSV